MTTIPRGGVHALDCGNRSVVARTTKRMSKRTLVLTPTTTAVAATIAIVHCSLPNRQRIAGQAASCTTRVWTTPQRERTAGGIATMTGGPGDSNVDQRQRQNAGCEGNALTTTITDTGSGRSGQGWMTKATDKSGWTMMASD